MYDRYIGSRWKFHGTAHVPSLRFMFRIARIKLIIQKSFGSIGVETNFVETLCCE